MKQVTQITWKVLRPNKTALTTLNSQHHGFVSYEPDTEIVTTLNNNFSANLRSRESRVEFEWPWPTLIAFFLWLRSLSDRILSHDRWVVWDFFFFFFLELVWFDCICVFDLNGLSLKEIIRIRGEQKTM